MERLLQRQRLLLRERLGMLLLLLLLRVLVVGGGEGLEGGVAVVLEAGEVRKQRRGKTMRPGRE